MIPRNPKLFRVSLPAMAIILASILLAVVLGIVTWRNLGREELLMAKFLRKEGLTLIRSFEAGARTSLIMNREEGSLTTLVKETAREETIAYIAVVDASGHLIASAGKWADHAKNIPVAAVLKTTEPVTRLIKDKGVNSVFEVAKEFRPEGAGEADTEAGKLLRKLWCSISGAVSEPTCRQAIFVGLYTREFDAARQEDVRQSLIMGGLLLLLGSSGFYFLFLSQGTRVAKATLANMELYTRNIIQSMPAGLLTVDNNGRVVSSNRKVLEIFGTENRDVEGKLLREMTGPEHCEIDSLVREGKEFLEIPIQCQRPDGENIPINISASRLSGRDGEPLGTVLILRDMREIRAMEDQLERSRRLAALGRMAAGIAHEIRNPLGTLRGFAQYFGSHSKEDPHAREYADLMIGEVDRLNRNISALLQFARPREPDFSDVQIGELLQRTMRLLQDDFAAHQLSFELDSPKVSITLHADPDLLTQVLINLLQNAMAATAAGGLVSLGARQENSDIHLWVQDTGKGMTAEEIGRMFDPFFTTRKTGTGLGLAVVHQIIEQHGGRVTVDSRPGAGTRVEVIFPQARLNEKN